MLSIVISGDMHYDLKTESIDRNNDIFDANMQVIEYCLELKNKGNKVIHINAGDVFHGTRPRAETIAAVISANNILEENEIETHIISGNHDVIDQVGRTSALEPILAIGYKFINIYHDIQKIKLSDSVYLITLPHISRAKAVENGFDNVQNYIEAKCSEIEETLSKGDTNIVISHLSLSGAKIGSEEFMIKGTHEEFPECLKNSKKIDYIFNGHYHKAQLIENPNGAPIIVVGNIQRNDFGERFDEKSFFVLSLEE